MKKFILVFCVLGINHLFGSHSSVGVGCKNVFNKQGGDTLTGTFTARINALDKIQRYFTKNDLDECSIEIFNSLADQIAQLKPSQQDLATANDLFEIEAMLSVLKEPQSEYITDAVWQALQKLDVAYKTALIRNKSAATV